jgi:hypothetical protein
MLQSSEASPVSARLRSLGLVVLLGVLTACVGPALTEDAYRDKAVESARAMISALETGRLAAVQASDHRLWPTTIAVILTDAEGDAASIEGQFASIQPPDRGADDARNRLTPLLERAADHLSGLRVWARRGDLERLSELARTLIPVTRALRSFVDANAAP